MCRGSGGKELSARSSERSFLGPYPSHKPSNVDMTVLRDIQGICWIDRQKKAIAISCSRMFKHALEISVRTVPGGNFLKRG